MDFGYIAPIELELLDSLHPECEVIPHLHQDFPAGFQAGGGRHLWLRGGQAGLPHHSQVIGLGGQDDGDDED